jgi:hypothetical protein
MYAVPRYCTLDGVNEIDSSLEGVILGTLEAYDTIRVQTLNSVYEVFLLDPASGRALVRGGKYFHEPTEAEVSGSTFGGCMLKVGWLGVGLRMEIRAKEKRIVTSPVQSLHVDRVEFGAAYYHPGESSFAEAYASRGH